MALIDRPQEPLLVAKEAAARLRVSVKTLMRLVHDGKLACVNIGSGKRHSYRFTAGDIQAFIDKETMVEIPPYVPTPQLPKLKTASPWVSFSDLPKPPRRRKGPAS